MHPLLLLILGPLLHGKRSEPGLLYNMRGVGPIVSVDRLLAKLLNFPSPEIGLEK